MADNTHKARYAEVRAKKLVAVNKQELTRSVNNLPTWFIDLYVAGRLVYGKDDRLTVTFNNKAPVVPEHGDWLVVHADGRLEVMTRTAFEMRYEDINAPKQQQLDLPEIN